MVRLMLVLAPVMCILSGVALASVLHVFMKSIEPPQKPIEKKSKKLVFDQQKYYLTKSQV